MGDVGKFLFGGETSGTPRETRQGSNQLANLLEAAMRGNSGGLQRFLTGMRPEDPNAMVARSMQNMLGFDPTTIDFSGAINRGLADPRDQTAGLFAALMPLERQAADEAATGLRSSLGTTGGRFGRSAGMAEARLRSELAARAGASREQAILQAGQNQNQFSAQLLSTLLPNMIHASTVQQGLDQELLRSFMGFFQPGAPVFQQGILGDLIGAGANLIGLNMMGTGAGGKK